MDFNKEAHKILKSIIQEGDFVVDGTMGNGYDTLFLSDAVGERGKVFAFDVQSLALESTKKYLDANAKNSENAKLILKSHAFISEEIFEELGQRRLSAATFNLGYLPKSPDKSVTTTADSSLKAMSDCLALANKDRFCLSVLCYIGHSNGYEEFLAVEGFFKERFKEYSTFRDINNEKSPILLIAAL